MNALSKNFPEQRSKANLVQVVRCDGDHGLIQAILDLGRAVSRDSVQFQKQKCSTDTSALISIKKALGFCEMKRIRCRNVELVPSSVEEGIARCCHCRIQEPGFPQSCGSSVADQRLLVKTKNIIEFQKIKHWIRLFGEFTEQGIILGENFLLCLCNTSFASIRTNFGPERGAQIIHRFLHFEKFSRSQCLQGRADFLNGHTQKIPDFPRPSSRFTNHVPTL